MVRSNFSMRWANSVKVGSKGGINPTEQKTTSTRTFFYLTFDLRPTNWWVRFWLTQACYQTLSERCYLSPVCQSSISRKSGEYVVKQDLIVAHLSSKLFLNFAVRLVVPFNGQCMINWVHYERRNSSPTALGLSNVKQMLHFARNMANSTLRLETHSKTICTYFLRDTDSVCQFVSQYTATKNSVTLFQGKKDGPLPQKWLIFQEL